MEKYQQRQMTPQEIEDAFTGRSFNSVSCRYFRIKRRTPVHNGKPVPGSVTLTQAQLTEIVNQAISRAGKGVVIPTPRKRVTLAPELNEYTVKQIRKLCASEGRCVVSFGGKMWKVFSEGGCKAQQESGKRQGMRMLETGNGIFAK